MTEPNSAGSYNIIAYLSDGAHWEEKDIDADKLTCINYAFGVVCGGLLKGSHLKKLHMLKNIKQKHPHLKIVLSIGGWGADGFSDAVLTEEGRKNFIKSIIDFVVSNNFDGADIDWEYPCDDLAGIMARKEDRENYTEYLRGLREALDEQGSKDGKQYILSIALGAGQKYVDDIEMAKVHTYLDYINVMTYDMRGSFTHITGHHTNLYSPKDEPNGISGDKAVNILIQAGVPAKKIILGAAFYSRIWEKVKGMGTGLNEEAETTGCKTCDFSNLEKDYINKNGYTRYWDDYSKAPYLFNGKTFVSYEDELSLKYKAEYVISRDIGGIMFWEYPLDKSLKLLNSMYTVLGCKKK